MLPTFLLCSRCSDCGDSPWSMLSSNHKRFTNSKPESSENASKKGRSRKAGQNFVLLSILLWPEMRHMVKLLEMCMKPVFHKLKERTKCILGCYKTNGIRILALLNFFQLILPKSWNSCGDWTSEKHLHKPEIVEGGAVELPLSWQTSQWEFSIKIYTYCCLKNFACSYEQCLSTNVIQMESDMETIALKTTFQEL